MHLQRVHRPENQLGTFSIVAPFVWVVIAIFGFVLLSAWPELFAASAGTQADVAASVADPPSSYVGSDPSLPAAASVFAGRSYEASQPIEQF